VGVALKLVYSAPPEYGDPPPPGASLITCPDCGGETWLMYRNATAGCAGCGLEIDIFDNVFVDEEDEDD